MMKLSPRFHVDITIGDILYLSYLVPVSRLRPVVPLTLPLAIVNGNMVFISVVTFHRKDIQLVGFPSLRLSYDQINVRTYVKDPHTGSHAVYFFRSGITSRTWTLLSRLLKLPWEHIPFALKTECDEKNHYLRYSASGNWHGELHIEVNEEAPQVKHISPFETVQEALRYLTGPLIGFYGSSPTLYRFEVWHSPIEPHSGRVLEIRFPFLTDLGLLEEREIGQPHNLLLASQGQFRVFLPPRRT